MKVPTVLITWLGLTTICPCSFGATPLLLEIHRSGDALELGWKAGLLQSAPTITGPWTAVVGGTGSKQISPIQSQTFYRLSQGIELTILKAGQGNGTIQSQAAGIVCGTDCSEVYPIGEEVILQAVPDSGSEFTGWSGACTGSTNCHVVMDLAKTVTATFALIKPVNAVLNGDFESGPSVGWQQQPGVLIVRGAELGVNPHSGNYVARLGYDSDNRRLARIGQRIDLPSATPLYLNFATWLYSEELCDVPYYDNILIYIANQTVVQEDRVCRGIDTNGWRRYSIDVAALAGQSVTVIFEISSADTLGSIMLLDDIAVSDKAWF